MKSFLVVIIFFLSGNANSQVLISLLLGEKLNSQFLEFGLEGGINFSDMSNLYNTSLTNGFNLGFYFDVKLKSNPSWMLNSGVIVKSPMGSRGLPVYSLNDEDLDKLFTGGTVERELRYFNVPFLVKHQFRNNIYVKGGFMAGLLSKAFDKFSKDIDNEDVVYKNNIRDQIHVIDAGWTLGFGYHISAGSGMNIGFQYYYGLVPVMKGDFKPGNYNRSFYVVAAIPIGKAKPARKGGEKIDDSSQLQY